MNNDQEHFAGDPLDAVQGLHLMRQDQSVEHRMPTEMELIEKALQMGPAGAEVIERIVAMKERSEDRQAKREFAVALRKLQKAIPPIQANGKNDKGVPYMYYEDIMLVLNPLLDAHGFSVSFKEQSMDDKGNVTFELHLWHDGGHLEIYPRTFPTDKAAMGNTSGKPIRTAIQDSGSTTSYARRYLTVSTFNIVEKGVDKDGDNMKYVSEEAVIWMKSACKSTGTSPEEFLRDIAKAESFEKIFERDYGFCKTALQSKLRAKLEKKPL